MSAILSEYSEVEFLKAKQRIMRSFYNNLDVQKEPYAAILGGQPGAGKSTIHRILKDKMNIGVINGDDYREFHPRFKEIQKEYGNDSVKLTAKFAGEMTEAIIIELSQKKYNLAIEGTLRTVEVPIKTCEMLKDKGYKVDLYMMAVKPEISYEGTVERYEEAKKLGVVARATPKDHHDLVVKALPTNVSEIYKRNVFDNILIFNRSKEYLFNHNKMPGIDPGDKMKEIFEVWSEKEKKDIYEIINRNIQNKKKRSAEDYHEYVGRVVEIPIFKEVNLVAIKHEIVAAGYKPNKNLIDKISRINFTLGKAHTIRDINSIFKMKDTYPNEIKELVSEIGEEFKKQERVRNKENEFELENIRHPK